MSIDMRLSYQLLATEESSHAAKIELFEHGIVGDLYKDRWHNRAICELILLNGSAKTDRVEPS